MGKIRRKQEAKAPGKGVGVKGDNILGKISADISAISLGPPRTKILKKTGGQGSSSGGGSSSSLSVNFASRLQSTENKKKKKVTFCQNLIEAELKESSVEGENAKQYFKVLHPSVIKKLSGRKELKNAVGGKQVPKKVAIAEMIPEKEALLSKSMPELRKIIGKGVKNKKTRWKVNKETFKRKMMLLKVNKDEIMKAKQRQQTVIVGDMNPILESLPSVEEMEADVGEKVKEETEEKVVPKMTKFSVKKTQKALLDSLKFFESAGVGKASAELSAN